MDYTRVRLGMIYGATGGFIAAIVLIVFLFLIGQTFGQRCDKKYESGSVEWSECVSTLSKGSSI